MRYLTESNRVWIVANKEAAKKIKERFQCDMKGFFDGSFLNFTRFPTDASLYLLLWDPKAATKK
jgi:hypothetical protein